MTETTTTTTRTTARRRRGGEGAQAGSLCHYGLQFAGPRRNVRRGRRGWGATVVTVVTLLVVSACVGYLWHCVRAWMGTGWKAYATPVPGLAMWPVSGVIAWGVVGLCLALLVGLAVQGWRELTPREEKMLRAVLDPHAGSEIKDGSDAKDGKDEAQAGKPMLLETTCLHCGKSMFVRREAPGTAQAGKPMLQDGEEGAV